MARRPKHSIIRTELRCCCSVTASAEFCRAFTRAGLAALFLVLAVRPTSAANPFDWKSCTSADPERKITACTRILQDRSEMSKSHAIAYFQRGIAHHDRGDLDRAMADYNEAIRLEPEMSVAYNGRGIVWRAKGDLDRAISDYNGAIRLNPKSNAAYNNRGSARWAKGDLDGAIADYDQAVQLNAKFALAYLNRGIAYLYGGAIAKARLDFLQASDLHRRDPYAALWLDIAVRRSNVPSQLAQGAKQLDMNAWPAPIVRLFLGGVAPADVMAAADNTDPKTKLEQLCEANFFSGVLALLQNAKETALPFVQFAADNCPRTFVEWAAANAELKALGLAR